MTATSTPPVIVDGVRERKSPPRYRHPSDVARLVFAVIVIGVILLIEAIAPLGLLTISLDLLTLVDGVPPALADGTVGLIQLTATVAPVAFAVLLIVRREIALYQLRLGTG